MPEIPPWLGTLLVTLGEELLRDIILRGLAHPDTPIDVSNDALPKIPEVLPSEAAAARIAARRASSTASTKPEKK